MKKIMMMFAAVLCCVVTMTVFTACGSDDKVRDYSYTIGFDNLFYHSEGDFNLSDWIKDVTTAYENALGVTSDTFTFHGTESECNDRVSECCKKAEDTVNRIKGGSATVVVTNNTTGKTVYKYYVKQ